MKITFKTCGCDSNIIEMWGVNQKKKEVKKMQEYRILWEKIEMGNTIVRANSEVEAKKIASETIGNSKIIWDTPRISIVGAYTFKYINNTIK